MIDAERPPSDGDATASPPDTTESDSREFAHRSAFAIAGCLGVFLFAVLVIIKFILELRQLGQD